MTIFESLPNAPPPLPSPLKYKIVHPLGIEVDITENSTCSIYVFGQLIMTHLSLSLYYFNYLRDYKWPAHLWNESPSC